MRDRGTALTPMEIAGAIGNGCRVRWAAERVSCAIDVPILLKARHLDKLRREWDAYAARVFDDCGYDVRE